MGIRYFAVTFPPDRVEEVTTDVDAYLRSDAHHQFTCHREPSAPTLDLDKSWRALQGAFSCRKPEHGRAQSASWLQNFGCDDARPAFDLVRGDVTNSCCGWEPYTGVRHPGRAAEIAYDLASLTAAEIDEWASACAAWRRDESEGDYIREMIARAQTFTAQVEAEGLGIIYWIG
jgi:hypothetical protein